MLARGFDEEDDLGLNLLTLGGYAVGALTLLIALAVGLPLATLGDGASIRFE